MAGASVWIINPYGNLPSEAWSPYRSTMLAERLAEHGDAVTQFISNFEHRSKTFRSPGYEKRRIDDRYDVEIIPATPYQRHISLDRVRYERAFGRNLVAAVDGRPRPDFVVLAEPSICYYDILMRPLLGGGQTRLIIDVIDIWPELFELAVPRPLAGLSGLAFAPLYAWRRRLYRRADGIVAVARDYLDLARRQIPDRDIPLEVVYWGWTQNEPSPGKPLGDAVRRLIAGKGPDDVWIVYAGTLGENYDIPAVVALADEWERTRPQSSVRFIVCGDGPLADFCRRHESPRLVFLGRLHPHDLEAVLERCDVALSTYKGASTVAMPIKAFDYLRFGLPVVNSLGRDLGALVRTREIGINYEAGSPVSLRQAVERLADDPARRARLSANARALAGEFSAARQYERFVSFLQRWRSA